MSIYRYIRLHFLLLINVASWVRSLYDLRPVLYERTISKLFWSKPIRYEEVKKEYKHSTYIFLSSKGRMKVRSSPLHLVMNCDKQVANGRLPNYISNHTSFVLLGHVFLLPCVSSLLLLHFLVIFVPSVWISSDKTMLNLFFYFSQQVNLHELPVKVIELCFKLYRPSKQQDGSHSHTVGPAAHWRSLSPIWTCSSQLLFSPLLIDPSIVLQLSITVPSICTFCIFPVFGSGSGKLLSTWPDLSKKKRGKRSLILFNVPYLFLNGERIICSRILASGASQFHCFSCTGYQNQWSDLMRGSQIRQQSFDFKDFCLDQSIYSTTVRPAASTEGRCCCILQPTNKKSWLKSRNPLVYCNRHVINNHFKKSGGDSCTQIC